jgi:hypothetical protein
MATKTASTAVAPAISPLDRQDKFAPDNLILYRTSLGLYKNLMDEGMIGEDGYCQIRTILNKKYGLSSDSIFAESA